MARLAREAFTAVALTSPGKTPWGMSCRALHVLCLGLGWLPNCATSYLVHYHFIVEGTKEWHFWLSRYLKCQLVIN